MPVHRSLPARRLPTGARRPAWRSPDPSAPRRIALYSHDTQGLGHIRRNTVIASALVAAHPGTEILLLTGAAEATSLPLPERTEVITLPRLHKDSDGEYSPRAWSGALGEVIAVRSAVVDAALAAFDPDLFVVDKVARGVDGELDRALHRIRAEGRTTTVLGLRDILDAPDVARREWEEQGCTAAVEQLYDAVWVYGDAQVHDPVAAYGLPQGVADKTTFTGYLSRGRTGRAAEGQADGEPNGHRTRGRGADGRQGRGAGARRSAGQDEPYVLCLVGGGQDGAAVAEAFAGATLPAGVRGVVVTGPYMPSSTRSRLHRRAGDRLTVLDFVPDLLPLVAGARAVVTMGGYNSVCEVLAGGTPALVVPRTRPRTEQLVRAERLSALGLVDVLACDPEPRVLSRWIRRATEPGTGTRAGDAPRSSDIRPVDLDGLYRLPQIVDELLQPRNHRADAKELRHAAR